jgi:3-oxoacid CoA-transferase B subunit
MGGAMDLVSSVKKIVVLMQLTDKNGSFKFRKSTELPVTGKGCVSMLISDKAVFEFTKNGVVLKEISKDTTVDAVRGMTDVEFRVADNLGYIEDNSSTYVGEDDDIFA